MIKTLRYNGKKYFSSFAVGKIAFKGHIFSVGIRISNTLAIILDVGKYTLIFTFGRYKPAIGKKRTLELRDY